MRVMLLGPNGQLGTDLSRLVAEQTGHIELIPLARNRLDVSDTASIPAVLAGRRFDVLINCTSYHKTDEVEHNATLAFTINTHAVKSLAEVCRQRGAKFIHISTDYVFRGDAIRPYGELDPPGPVNVYGASKAMGENLAILAYPRGSYILRVASLFGVAGASGKGGNFVETMIKLGREKGKLRIVNDVTMSPTATADVARMIWGLLESGAEPGVYHAVNSGKATWYEFACEIVRRANVNAVVEPIGSDVYPTAAMRPPYSVLNNGKLVGVLGRIPAWQDALECYLLAKGHISTANGACSAS